MRPHNKYRILRAIKTGEKYSRNNRDMAYLRMNGYIEAKGVVHTSYVNAEITLTDWGHAYLKNYESGLLKNGE
jgi:hypothetical protein